jgi:peptide/nickel transport system ATP-binding protein
VSGPLLDIEGLTVSFGAAVPAVDALSLTLESGGTLGVVGESGSGKTMLARAILGLLPPGARVSANRLRFGGSDLCALDAEGWLRVRGAGIGLVLQEPLSSLNPAMTVGAQLCEGLRLHAGISDREARRRALEALEEVRIVDPEQALRRYPHELSGGQRQRMLIASVLLLRPKLIIADEPATALDALVGEEVMDLVTARAAQIGAGLLLISHDLAQVARRAQSVLVMHRGRAVESGRTESVLLAPGHPYTRRLLAAVPRRNARAEPCRSGTPLLVARDISLAYAGVRRGLRLRTPSVRALDGVSFELRRGETLAVIGESGSGKSSLAMIALGLTRASEGRLEIEGRTWEERTAVERRALRRRVQVIFQDPAASLDPRMRVGAIVGEGLLHEALTRDALAARVATALEEVDLDAACATRFPHQLSGGQRQRVAIARALVMNPELVVADEPVSALDVTVQAQILELLERLKATRAFALMLVSHDLGVVEHIADRVMVMRAGRVVEAGTRDQVFDAPGNAYTRRLLSIAPMLVPAGEGYRLVPRPLAIGPA